MFPDLPAPVSLLAQLGLVGVVVAALYYAILLPRKNPDGTKRRSALLTPGWIVDQRDDEHQAELVRVRNMYEKGLLDAQDAARKSVEHWRALRDEVKAEAREAKAESKDLRELLKELQIASREHIALTNEQTRDIAVLLELQRLVPRDAAKPGDSGHG